MSLPDHLTLQELADYFGVSRWTVGRAIKAGEFKVVRVPGRGRNGAKRVPRDSVLEFLARNTEPAATQSENPS